MTEPDPLDATFPHWAKLSCGCKITTHIENGKRAVYFMPCSRSCKYYHLVVKQAELFGKPVVRRSADVN